jgi:hypothetical protein
MARLLATGGLTGEPRDQALYVLSLAVLATGTGLALLALRRPALDALAGAVSGAGVAAWLLSNTAAEGPTLLVLLPGNGVTLADLAAAPAVVLLSWLCVRRLRQPHGVR